MTMDSPFLKGHEDFGNTKEKTKRAAEVKTAGTHPQHTLK